MNKDRLTEIKKHDKRKQKPRRIIAIPQNQNSLYREPINPHCKQKENDRRRKMNRPRRN